MHSSRSNLVMQMEIDGSNTVLPQDVITNILIRLPVKSLIRFKCVCKEWKNLFKTQSFIERHLQHSTHQKGSLIFEDYSKPNPFRMCLLDREMQVLEVHSDPIIDSTLCVWAIDSCNGLICLALANDPRSLSLLVWNPAIREARLVSGVADCCVDEHFCVGFGFSPTVNEYKILKIRTSSNDDLVNQVEVYSLNMGTWKGVEIENLDGVSIFTDGFTFNGAIFWIGLKLGDEEEDEDDVDILVSFDIATEVFTLIPMPPSPLSFSNTSYSKQLAVYENKLVMLSHTLSEEYKSSLIHLWVMEEGTCASREGWSWIKKYTSSPYLGFLLLPMTVWRNEIVCNVDTLPGPIDPSEDKRKTVMFNFETNEFRMLDIRTFAVDDGIFNYAESLLPTGGIHIE